MNEICNHIKNAVDNRIEKYEKKNLFNLTTIDNLEKKYTIKYLSNYRGVDFSIEMEYIDNEIKFSTFIDVSYSSETSFEITDFIRFIVSMSQDDLKNKFNF